MVLFLATLALSSAIQLPGNGPNPSVTYLNVHNVSGILAEGTTTRVDDGGEAFLSSIPGFQNVTIGAANLNARAPNYGACAAPITCQPNKPRTQHY